MPVRSTSKKRHEADGIAAKRDVHHAAGKKCSGCETVEDVEAADGGFRGIFEIEKIFEREFLEAGSGKGREFSCHYKVGVRFVEAGFAGGADFTLKSAVRMTVSLVSRSMAVTSMV